MVNLGGNTDKLGVQGEKWALDYLVAKGYAILEKNYRYRKAEIDILARKGETLVVVEVKTRGKNFLVPLSQTITKKKIGLLVAAADHYVTANRLSCEVRFDVLAITLGYTTPKIQHLEDAFYHF